MGLKIKTLEKWDALCEHRVEETFKDDINNIDDYPLKTIIISRKVANFIKKHGVEKYTQNEFS